MSAEPPAASSPSEPAAAPAAPAWKRLWQALHSRFARQLAIGAVVLGGFTAAGHFIGGMIGWWHLYEVAAHKGATPAQGAAKSGKLAPVSIVVLPLLNESDSQDDTWFTDSLSTDLTTELGRFPGALVISRDTAFTYRGKAVDPREVSQQLGARYVVRGTVRRDGRRVRLNLSMVDGESGAQHWAQQFDMDRAELGKSLERVAGEVGRSLSVQLYRSAAQRATALKPEEVQADDIAMQGWGVWFRGLSKENLLEARTLFEAAVARDPNTVRGWGGVASTNGLGAGIGWVPDRAAAIARVETAVDRLQVLDENNLFTYLARNSLFNQKDDYEALLRNAKAMAERFPNHPQSMASLGFASMSTGRFDDCLEPLNQALRLGPRDSFVGLWNWTIATCHFMRGEYKDSAEFARTAMQVGRNLPLPPLTMAAALARDGRADEARALVEEYRAKHPEFQADHIGRFMRSKNPKYVEGKERLISTLRELGLP